MFLRSAKGRTRSTQLCNSPPAPNGSKIGAIQINDVFVDERRIVYCVDRFTGGLYILEPTF